MIDTLASIHAYSLKWPANWTDAYNNNAIKKDMLHLPSVMRVRIFE